MNELQEKIKTAMEKSNGLMKTAALYELGMDYRDIDQLLKEGYLVRVKSGYYRLAEEEQTEEEMIKAFFPDGVLCMETALYCYGYIKERPLTWHIAIDKNTSKSRFLMDYPIVQPHYTESAVLSTGVEQETLNGVVFNIYDRDRLICDCLKYESKLSHEDLKAALRGYLEDPKKDVSKLLVYAKDRRVLSKVQKTLGVWL